MKKQTAGKEQLGDFAPQFAKLNDEVLFGEVWAREEQLSLKLRSILVVTSFISRGIFDSSFQYHMQNAKNNGVSKEEMVEIITHLSFYVGWPYAWAAFKIAKEVYQKDMDVQIRGGYFGLGHENTAFSPYFIGKSYLNPLTKPTDALFIANVTFEPKCRNNWHIHHATKGGGQVLICVDGYGYYQEEGKEVQLLKPRDIVLIPANVKHWHGARKNSWFSHLAFEIPGENTLNEFLEEVNDTFYKQLE